MTYIFPSSLLNMIVKVVVAALILTIVMSKSLASELELVCTDQDGRSRLLKAHTDAMLIYNPARPQDIFWLDTSTRDYNHLIAFENPAWSFIYDRNREIGTLYQRVFGDLYICHRRQPA